MLAFIGCAGLLSVAADEPKPFVIQTVLGETFRGCHVIKVTPAALTIAHDAGVTKIPFPLLEPEWQKLFHYSKERAAEFEEQEAAQRRAAEAKAKSLRRERDKMESKHMDQLVRLEKEELAEQARREQEWRAALEKQAAAAAASATPAPPLAPFPGDPKTPQAPTSSKEAVIPSVTPLGMPYTPGVSRSQTYVIPNSPGYYVVPGSGTVFITPSQGYPNNYYPPGSRPIHGTAGQITVGPNVIRVGP